MNYKIVEKTKDSNVCLFDFETYNLCLNFDVNKPWQFASIETVNGNIIKETDILIKWPNPPKMGEKVRAMTRFSDEKLDRLGVTPEEGFKIIKDVFARSDFILGHNILGFDLYLWKEWCLLMGEQWMDVVNKSADTNCLAKGLKLGVPYTSQEDMLEYCFRLYHRIERGIKTNQKALGKEFDIEHDYENLHDALCDIKLLAKIWNVLKYRLS